MKIYILEDDFAHMGRLETCLDNLIKKHQLKEVTIESYTTPDDLLKRVSDKGNHVLFFLDIELQSASQKGLDVGQVLRTKDPYAIITFVTTHSEYMPLTFEYQVKASEYISKELDKEAFETRVEKILLSTYQNIAQNHCEEVFTLHTAHLDSRIPFHELLYIETSGRSHHIVIYTTTETIELTTSLEEIHQQEPRLFRCHRSILVNPNNIQSINRKEKQAYFITGETCPIARGKLKELEALWTSR